MVAMGVVLVRMSWIAINTTTTATWCHLAVAAPSLGLIKECRAQKDAVKPLGLN